MNDHLTVMQVLPALQLGGVERGVIELSHELVKRGHKSIVISSGGDLVKDVQKGRATHYTIDVATSRRFFFSKIVSKVRDITVKENVDIVDVHSNIPARIGWHAIKGTKATFITSAHSFYSPNNKDSRFMAHGKLVICVSESISKYMIDTFDIRPEHIRVIPRWVDLKNFAFRPPETILSKDPVILIVGRIAPCKGHHVLLKAFQKVIKVLPDLKLWIAGETNRLNESYKRHLEHLVQELHLTNHVQFLGIKRNIAQIFNQATLLVHPAVHPEPFGRVIIEAQAVGVPVISTSMGGPKEIIDDQKTGRLVPPNDIDSLANAIIELLNNPSKRMSMLYPARKKVEQFYQLEPLAEKTIQTYQEARHI